VIEGPKKEKKQSALLSNESDLALKLMARARNNTA
jgi:hypothetical protein